MLVVDIEATGTDPQKHSLLSIGAVDFERPERQFYVACRAFAGAHIENEALAVCGFTREGIADTTKPSEEEALRKFLQWAEEGSERTIAGQNPSFDRDALMHACRRYHINWPFAHRTIDLHSICWFHMKRQGVEPLRKNAHSALNLDAIMAYVGVPIARKAHNALEDARFEAEAFSRLIFERTLF